MTEFVILTGIRGMMEFDFACQLQFLGISSRLKCRYYFDSFNKRLGFKYISLVDRHGLYKIKFYVKKRFPIHLYKGTECILQTDNFESVNDRISKQR